MHNTLLSPAERREAAREGAAQADAFIRTLRTRSVLRWLAHEGLTLSDLHPEDRAYVAGLTDPQIYSLREMTERVSDLVRSYENCA